MWSRQRSGPAGEHFLSGLGPLWRSASLQCRALNQASISNSSVGDWCMRCTMVDRYQNAVRETGWPGLPRRSCAWRRRRPPAQSSTIAFPLLARTWSGFPLAISWQQARRYHKLTCSQRWHSYMPCNLNRLRPPRIEPSCSLSLDRID